ncbi:hypothetical protein RRG08_014069 [Elysia crispata]|uniref:Uncharacterized protein n=1 Tax=Elysia crispata TaxID=231223 RepID=A0AAE1DQ07_9GAST|nr:hypothetical protein RRG08_014069 [Elysia crispata]
MHLYHPECSNFVWFWLALNTSSVFPAQIFNPCNITVTQRLRMPLPFNYQISLDPPSLIHKEAGLWVSPSGVLPRGKVNGSADVDET